MRVLCLTIGPETEPSSRFRVYQYAEPLAGLGIALDVRPRVGRRYVELGFGLRRPGLPVRLAAVGASLAARTLRRVRDLVAARRYDAVWVQKETFPFGLDRLVRSLDVPVVFDFDDAIYAAPGARDGLGPGVRAVAERLVRREEALARLLPRCAAVWAGSPVLADWARARGARVEIVPTVVDTDVYPVRPVRRVPRGGTLSIGWIGAPAGSAYLEPLRPVFGALARRFPLRLVVRGTADFSCPGVEVDARGWRTYRERADEAADLEGIDVGIMPLPAEPWAAGKCALKAIQFMASGIPVVVSPVGANAEVVVDGVTGFHAVGPARWRERLARLLESPSLRHRLGRAGRAHVERHYSLAAAAPRVAELLRDATRTAVARRRGDRPRGRARAGSAPSAAGPSSTPSATTT